MSNIGYFAHPTAEVSPSANIGTGTAIWNQAQVRENASVGCNVVVSKNVYIDTGVSIGNNCKLQNNVSVYDGVTLEDGVFVGPHVCFTNDRYPRAITAEGELKSSEDWEITPTLVCRGASIGAHCVVLPGVTIGAFAMVGAGSVVTVNVPSHTLVVGSPATVVGFVCQCGHRLLQEEGRYRCPICGQIVSLEPVHLNNWESNGFSGTTSGIAP